jgi:cbb3-type cytochrome oxidase subunit 3
MEVNSVLYLLILLVAFIGIVIYVFTGKKRAKQFEEDSKIPFLNDKDKLAMHFTQPTTRYSMWAWKSRSPQLSVLIIRVRLKNSMSGLAARKLALTTLRDFGGLMVFLASTAGAVPISRG